MLVEICGLHEEVQTWERRERVLQMQFASVRQVQRIPARCLPLGLSETGGSGPENRPVWVGCLIGPPRKSKARGTTIYPMPSPSAPFQQLTIELLS